MLTTSPSGQVTSTSGSLASVHLSNWLTQHQLSLVITTYQSNELLLTHPTSEGLSIARHAFERLVFSTRPQLWPIEIEQLLFRNLSRSKVLTTWFQSRLRVNGRLRRELAFNLRSSRRAQPNG